MTRKNNPKMNFSEAKQVGRVQWMQNAAVKKRIIIFYINYSRLLILICTEFVAACD